MKQKCFYCLFLISFLLLNLNLYSQQIQMAQTSGPEGSPCRTLKSCQDGSLIAYFTSDTYRSTDNGISWQKLNLPTRDHIYASPKGPVIIGDENGVYRRSFDNGKSWDSCRIKGIGANNSDADINNGVFDTSGSFYTVILNNAIYKTDDNGNSWTRFATVPGTRKFGSKLIITLKGTLIYSADSCLSRSSDNGVTWTRISGKNGLSESSFAGGYITNDDFGSIVLKNNTIIIQPSNSNSVYYYYSTDDGLSWKPMSVPYVPSGYNYTLCSDAGGILWCFYDSQIFKSNDYGVTWNKVVSSGSHPFNWCYKYFITPNGTIFASSDLLWRSTDNGTSWQKSIKGLVEGPATSLAMNSSGTVFCVSANTVYTSEDKGNTWAAWAPTGHIKYIYSFFVDKKDNYYTLDGNAIYISTDKGKSWITSKLGYSNVSIKNLCADGNGRIAASAFNGNFLSTDFGDSWKKIAGWDKSNPGSVFLSEKGEIFQITDSGLYRSEDAGATWVNLRSEVPEWSTVFVNRKGKIFIGSVNMSYGGFNYDLLSSSDNGKTWNSAIMGRNEYGYLEQIMEIGEDASGRLFAHANTSIYTSKDNGNTWTKFLDITGKSRSYSSSEKGYFLIDKDGYLYTTVQGNGVHRSIAPVLPLLPPEIYSASAVDGKATIKWSKNKSPNFNNYAVYISGEHYPSIVINETTGGANDTVITISGLTNNKPYYLVVSAIDKLGNEAYSKEFSVVSYPSPSKPVLSLLADKSINTSISPALKWNQACNTDIYSFQLSKDSLFSSVIVNDSTLTDTVKQVSGLQNLTKYFWRVRGKNNVGCGQWSDTWQFTTIIAAPAVPTASLPVNNGVNQQVNQTFRWTRSSRSEQYHLQLSKDQAFSSYSYNDSTLTDTLKTLELSNGTKYFWRVRGKNIGGVSPWSETAVLTTIVAAPENPELVYPGDMAVNMRPDVTLKWNTSPRAEKYVVQIALDSQFMNMTQTDSSVADTMKKVNPLIYDMKYYWRVKARNIGGESNWSKVWSFTTVISAPNYPYQFSPENNAVNQPVEVPVKWQKLKDAEKYHLQISAVQNFSNFVFNDSTLTDTLKVISALKNNTSYYWRVRAGNIGGFGPWSEVWTFKTIVALPSVPVLLSPANASKNQPVDIKLSWNQSENAETFRLLVSQDTLFTSPVTDDSSLTSVSKDITGLKSGMKYYWKVRAKNAAGLSSYTPYWSFTTLLPSPASLNAATDGLKKVKLTWTDKSEGETGFIIERNRENEAGYKIIDTLKANTTTYTDSTVLLATTYKYRLRAYTAFISSDYSNEAGVTTLTSVANSKVIPTENALMQNYPNPFNPSTVISYSLFTESRVRVVVYNSLGQQVSELVNRTQPGGYYEEVFDAGSLPSGIYIYSISAQSSDGKNNYTATRKMILVK